MTERTNVPGWVYVLTNSSMPGLVKVGYTERSPDLRALELSITGAPTPYEVAYQVEVHDPRAVERAAHEKLAK